MYNSYQLTGSAFVIYQQLNKKKKEDFDAIKEGFFTAFAMDSFVGYVQFVEHCLCPGGTVDVFLADLKRISVLFG